MKTERQRAFIIRILFLAIWVVLIYCGLKYVLPFIMPFVLAFFVAFLLRRPAAFLCKKTVLSRKLSGVLVLTIFYLIFGSLFVLLISRIFSYIGFQLQNLPSYYENYLVPALTTIGQWIDDFFANSDPALATIIENVSASLTNSLSNIVGSISQWAINLATATAQRIPGIVVNVFIMLISSFFFVADYGRITQFIAKQLSPKMNQRVHMVKNFVVNVLLKYLRAYSILIFITFAEVSIGMLILRVPLPFLIAALTAIVDILPVLGTGTIMIPWAIYCLLTGNYFLGIGLLVLYGVITLVRQIIEPRIVGGQIGLYPLLTLIGMYIGAQLFGIWGMFGLPITFAVLIQLNRNNEISLFKE